MKNVKIKDINIMNIMEKNVLKQKMNVYLTYTKMNIMKMIITT